MRFPIWILLLTAVLGVGIVFVSATLFINPQVTLITSAAFDQSVITPNADGDDDITTFRYELSRSAAVSLWFENEAGDRFFFRETQQRTPQEYAVLFSGVVDGYTLPGETVPGVVERRLMPEGDYTWTMIAENANEREERSGSFTITDADSELPIMTTFTLSSPIFTPNQDSIADRMVINIFLEKAADLNVDLVTEDGRTFPITERAESTREGQAGRYIFDYAGGVDLNQDPPPDGTYRVVATAQDAVGQRTRRETELTIALGGKPRARIAPQFVDTDVNYRAAPYDEAYYTDATTVGQTIPQPGLPAGVNVRSVSVPAGDLLVFRLTVENYSDVPIRTTGPAPGTVYQQDQHASSLGWLEEPGAWRVGLECETSPSSYPYRWAVGTAEDLIVIEDPATGEEFTYLPPNTSTVVWGAVRLSEIIGDRNPQLCYAGLIHEKVAIALENSAVDPHDIFIADAAAEPEPID